MEKVVFFVILFCFTAVVCFPQKSQPPIQPIASKTAPTQPLKEIPDADWKILIDAVQADNWEKSQSLASIYLAKIKVENNKKQMARLRYILLYSLAGKIAVAPPAAGKPEENQTRIQLEKTANEFLGKEFFMPSRQLSGDCQGKLNYICQTKQQKDVLRATTANPLGTTIYSFEYVRLKDNFSFGENIGKQAIIGGVLKKIEFNPNRSSIWIMRLFFENGTINIVPDN